LKEELVGFFVLEHPTDPVDDALTDFHPAAGTKRGHAPLCPRCGDPIGMKMRLAPIRAELETLGKRFGDLAFGVSNDVLVSERFKDAFLSSGLIGLSGFMPAQIVKVIARRGKITSPMPNYFVAVPGRSRALIDDRASGIDYERRWTCEECRIGQMKRLRRVVLEPGTWSGEDVFIPRGLPGTVVTSERFKQFCDLHAFTNCSLIRAEQYHFDHFHWEQESNTAVSERDRK
jgi:hypothetical protein